MDKPIISGKNFLDCLQLGQSVVVEVLDFANRLCSNRCVFVSYSNESLTVRDKNGEYEIPRTELFTVYIPQ
jgi:hypothetical protein